MSLSTPFIKRPIATSLLTIALAMAGALAFYFLPVAPLPQVEYPTININANLPGAAPETMASAVTAPLEKSFGRIAGITEMTSFSSTGGSNITIQFDLDRSVDSAARDVQAAINAARGQLPANLPNNPNYRKQNPADNSVLTLALTSEVEERTRMYDVAESILNQKIAQIRGIGQVNISGSSRPSVRVQINPTALTKFDIGWEQILATLNAANANRPKGQLSDGQHTWQLATTDQLFKAAEYRPLIVAFKNGAPIRLSDLGKVEDSLEDRRNFGLANGKPAVLIEMRKQPSANIIETVDRVKALLPLLKASIPPTMNLSIVQDRTTAIRASIQDIERTIIISIGLVVLVVFIFLRNGWATIIPSISVPLSLLGTFGVMYLLHYSVDNLSLMALAISTGFVVDDAIVVIENITRYLEMGMRPAAAALAGAKEIAFTVLSMSTSLVAVFIPLLFMGGLLGRLFREFSVTLAVAIGISLIVSLTTTPSMCAKFLRPEHDRRHGILYRAFEKGFDWLLGGYRYSLRWVLQHPAPMLALTIGTACVSVYLYIIMPKGFFPQQDNGQIQGGMQSAPNQAFAISSERLQQFMKIVMADPAVEDIAGSIQGTRGFGFLHIQLKPLEERKVSADQVIARLRPKTQLPGSALFLQADQEIRMGGRVGNAQFQYTLQSDNIPDLQTWANVMLERIKALPQVRDSNTDLQNKGLEARAVIDRDTAARLGVTPQIIDNALYSAFGQRQVSTMYGRLNQYHVIMEAELPYQENPDSLQNIYVRSSNGGEVPLSSFIHYESGVIAQNINHQGQFPSVTLTFNLAPGVSLGEAVDAVHELEREVRLPVNVHGNFAGTAQAFQAALANQPWLILAALLTVYIVLGVLYESYIHPITILSTLPSAGVGALLALLITKSELNVIGIIGIILLIGIVKKNAIMMIDFALEAERRDGKGPLEGIYQACLLRFRPIMMTTMAALLGGLPLALGRGTGSEMRRPLGIAIVGGLMLSQLLTLYTTPVVYLYLDRLRLWLELRSKRLPRLAHSTRL
jgi:multidrug efflux pump